MKEHSVNEFSNEIQEALARLAADNKSGAAEILRRARNLFDLLRSDLLQQDALNHVLALQSVIDVSIALARTQPNMSPLLRLASAAVTAARGANDARRVANAAAAKATHFVEAAARAAVATAEHGSRLIQEGSRLLTHSRSSTVLGALLHARRGGREFSVIATESRPMLEGRVLAEELAQQGVYVELVADAAAAIAIDDVDLVLVGGDCVTPSDLVNKIGTRMVALAARERNIPIYAMCDTSKFVGSGPTRMLDQADASELWPNAPRGVRVVNRYFERTPLGWFAAIVTEDGALSSAEAALAAKREPIDAELAEALEA